MAKIPMNDSFALDKFNPYKDTLVTTVYGSEEEVKEVLDKLMGEANGVNQGVWVKLDGQMLPPELHGKHRCSRCRNLAGDRRGREYLSNYCPSCGARMEMELMPDAPEEYDKTMVFSKKKWKESPIPEDVKEDALQSGWVDACDGKPVEKGMCGKFLIVDTWCVDADEWEACDDE